MANLAKQLVHPTRTSLDALLWIRDGRPPDLHEKRNDHRSRGRTLERSGPSVAGERVVVDVESVCGHALCRPLGAGSVDISLR